MSTPTIQSTIEADEAGARAEMAVWVASLLGVTAIGALMIALVAVLVVKSVARVEMTLGIALVMVVAEAIATVRAKFAIRSAVRLGAW
jgi:hypothetical protein